MDLQKLNTYLFYLGEYLKNGDVGSVIASVKYLRGKGSHSHDRIIRSSIGKFYCRKNTNDFQFANYRYEWGVKKYLLNQRENFNIFIDGGSCIGEYSVLMTRFGMRCIAFEPVIMNFNVLIKNLELNGVKDKILAFPVGLGNKHEQAMFFFNPVNTGASHIVYDKAKANCVVDINTLDSFLTKMSLKKDDRILVKLDVEQMETVAIEGSQNFIRTFPNITFVIEEKHTGAPKIRTELLKYADFEFGIVDEFNMYARKK